jgi:hypothetical protein
VGAIRVRHELLGSAEPNQEIAALDVIEGKAAQKEYRLFAILRHTAEGGWKSALRTIPLEPHRELIGQDRSQIAVATALVHVIASASRSR